MDACRAAGPLISRLTGIGEANISGRATWTKAAALAALCLVSASCAKRAVSPAPPDQSGSARLVSLNPCTDAILLEVAEPAQVLAISHYSHDPASSSIPQRLAHRFAATGGTVEEIVALDPDLVLASTFLPPATGQAMRDLGQDFRTFASPTTIEESLAQIRSIGRLAGHADTADRKADFIRQEVTAAAAPEGFTPISTVLWQPGEIVPGNATLIGEMMRIAGFSSHSEALGLGQAQHLSLEILLAHPPELLLVAGSSRGQLHPALRQLKDTRVEPFDASLLYCGGPTIPRVMERLAEIRDDMRGEGG